MEKTLEVKKEDSGRLITEVMVDEAEFASVSSGESVTFITGQRTDENNKFVEGRIMRLTAADFPQKNVYAEILKVAPTVGVKHRLHESVDVTVRKIVPRISEAESFDELFYVLKERGGIIGATLGHQTADDLKIIIDNVRFGLRAINDVTRTNGLRERVIYLMEKEKKQK